MTVAELIGKVAVAMLHEELGADAATQGTGRFALNLSADQTAAVAHAVLADPVLNNLIEMKLPAEYLSGAGLPQEVLTTLPATYFRNAACTRSAFLLADVEHGEEASFNEIARLGPAELMDRIELWVRISADELHISSEQTRWWERALTGLRDLRLVSLDRFASYVLGTRHAVHADGLPLLHALGFALPNLRLPRDTCYFNGLKEKSRNFPSAWKGQFAAAQKRRAGLLYQPP